MTDEKKGMKRVPRLRFPEFRDAGEWEEKALGDIIKLEYGAPLPESSRTGGTIPVIGSNGVIGYHKEPLIQGPAIVVGRKGSAGQVIWVESSCFPIDTTFYVVNQQESVSFFIYALLNFMNLPELARAEGIPGLNRNEVHASKVSIPKTQEQNRIADCLSSLDELIAAEDKKLEAYQQHKQGLMQRLFPRDGERVPRLRFPEFRDAGEWERNTLGEFFIERSDRGDQSCELLSVTMNKGVIKASELERKSNTSSDVSNYKIVKTGDIVYNSMRMWQGASGVSWFDGIVSPAYTVVTPKTGQNALFWAQWFRHNDSIDKFARFSQGVTSDTWNLKYPSFSKIELLAPRKEEQSRIADCLSSLDGLIDAQRRRVESLRTFKTGLMQQLFPRTSYA